jgi:hypothetical protein
MPKKPATRLNPTLIISMGGACNVAASYGDGGTLPTRILIASWGENEARTHGAKFTVGKQTVKQLAATHAKNGWDTVSLDYEHQSVKGHPNFKPDPREYAAHGTVEVVENEGLYYLPKNYTPSGKTHAANYPDVSGLFIVDATTREVIGVPSVALVQHGDVAGAVFNQALAASALGIGSADAEVMTFARELLELGEDATPEDVSAGLESLVRAKNTPDPKLKTKTTTMEKTEPTETDKRIEALTTTVTQLATTVTTLVQGNQVAAHNQAVDAVFSVAASQGKKVPEGLKAKNEAGQYVIAASTAQEVLAAIPQTESVEFLTPEYLAASAGVNRMQQGAENQVMLALGITEEVWKKGTPLVAGNTPHGELAKAIALKA